MLIHLHIRDFAIIPALELDFNSGFTAITGETGAGKSILVDALGLLLGDRSDSTWVRPGAEKAELNASFNLGANSPATRWLADADLGDGEECLLRRTIASSGRSRAWINGTPVTLQQLGDLGSLLVELHGQNEHVRLTGKKQQLYLLDSSGAYAASLEKTEEAFHAWRKLDEAFQAILESSGLPARELEYLGFQLRELQHHALSPEALAELEREHGLLAKGGELLEGIRHSLEALDSDGHGIHSGLHQSLGRLEAFEALDTDILEARRMLQEAAINCQEAGSSLRRARDRVDLNPARLEAVADQLSTLGDLARKHHVPMEQLCEVRDQLADRLGRAENFDQQRDALETQRNTALSIYRTAAKALSRDRSEHAASLSTEVTRLMSALGMAGGGFEINVIHDPGCSPSRRGDDGIELLVSANPGMPPGPLAKIASGGELSRISLAIKVASRQGGTERTQIFDEVDAGIGGDTANAVGKLLQRLADGGQALCVTHLAQVAVRASRQLQVRKETGKTSISIDTTLLDNDERVEEIARMLSGKVSDQSRAHAAELLAAAQSQL
jgi:DNA repair protein RecN (Recombination protein N)